MKKIDSVHLEKFYEVLSDLNEIFPLNMENIRSVIEDKRKKSFPGKEETAIVLAVNDDIREQCMPHVPIIAITSAPNHLSEHVGILEFKIIDSKKNSAGGVSFIAWLSVFPSGRMVFGMEGVSLDSNGKKIILNRELALRDHKFYDDKKVILKLRSAMVSVFRSKEISAIEAQQKLLILFSEPLPDNN